MTTISINNLGGVQQDQANARAEQTTAQAEAQRVIDLINAYDFTDKDGNKIKFDTLADWKAACQAGNLYKSGQLFGQGHTQYLQFLEQINPALRKLDAANAQVAAIDASASSLEAMKKLLDSGDIEGAVTMLFMTRVQVCDDQLKSRIGAMQERNARIQQLNASYAYYQKEAIVNPKNADAVEQAQKLKGQIDGMNSDSSLEMIGVQTLTTQRNQAFEAMSNLIAKFSKAKDTIIGNIR